MGKDQHVTLREDGKWQVLGENNSKATAVFNTQKEASAKARDIAINQESELIIHGKDGKIRDKHSYGNDPKSIKG